MGRWKVEQSHPVYQRALKREGNFWKGQGGDPANPTGLPAALLRYRQQCQTGSEEQDIYSYLEQMGPFQRGLSIGCGSAVVERELLRRGIVHKFTFVDISADSLKDLQRSLSKRMRKRAKLLQQDLNFIGLESGKYDFIFCANALHHVINLEHVILELNKALSPKGILVVDDFIGENRLQFSSGRVDTINRLAKRAASRTGVRITPMIKTSRSVLMNTCPFEAVRSEDILPLLKKVYGEHTIRQSTYGAVTQWMNVAVDFGQQGERLEQAAAIFVKEDRTAAKRGTLAPLMVFGVYRKNPQPPRIDVKPWTRRELKQNLDVSRFDEGWALRLGERIRSALGDGWFYATLKRAYFRVR